jgi:hypothetical protein
MGLEYGLILAEPLLPGIIQSLLNMVVLMSVAYGCVFTIGLLAARLTPYQLRTMAMGMAAVCMICALHLRDATGAWVPTNMFKYPPQIYYLSYALSVGLMLVSFRPALARLCDRPFVKEFISFAGSNSLWIYLWHILALSLLFYIEPAPYLLKYVLVYGFAILATWFQVHAVRVASSHAAPRTAYWLNAVFTG